MKEEELFMKEIWKDIQGYEGLYQVSNLGNIKSFYTGKILKGGNYKGYLRLNLYKNGVKSMVSIHRLVAQTFIPNPENKPEVNHIDEDTTNNMVSNLEWMTSKENCNHGTRNDRLSTPILAINITTGKVKEYSGVRECARKLNLHSPNIIAVLKGRYKQTGGYTFKYK